MPWVRSPAAHHHLVPLTPVVEIFNNSFDSEEEEEEEEEVEEDPKEASSEDQDDASLWYMQVGYDKFKCLRLGFVELRL